MYYYHHMVTHFSLINPQSSKSLLQGPLDSLLVSTSWLPGKEAHSALVSSTLHSFQNVGSRTASCLLSVSSIFSSLQAIYSLCWSLSMGIIIFYYQFILLPSSFKGVKKRLLNAIKIKDQTDQGFFFLSPLPLIWGGA